MASKPASSADTLQQFYSDIDRQHLVPLWNITSDLLSPEPKPRVLPHLWRWTDLAPLAQQAGELVPIERGGERRVLGLINPGLRGKYAATHTLWAGVQILFPGERAPAHRHSPAAIRFIMQGQGSHTTVDGDKCIMERGDLVLTPPWTWHDHGNDTSEPMYWMDGLDIPLILDLNAVFFEPFPEDTQPQTSLNFAERRYGAGQLKPAGERLSGLSSPLLNYKWEQTAEALGRLAQMEVNPFDDVALEYTNPYTGGPVLPTLTCWIQLLRPQVHTKAHRQVNSAVYYVFAGSGYSVIGGKRFDWTQGDFFTVPPWAWHEHANAGTAEAILFSIQDTPVMEALGLYHEQAYEEHNGHQPVTSVFGDQ